MAMDEVSDERVRGIMHKSEYTVIGRIVNTASGLMLESDLSGGRFAVSRFKEISPIVNTEAVCADCGARYDGLAREAFLFLHKEVHAAPNFKQGLSKLPFSLMGHVAEVMEKYRKETS